MPDNNNYMMITAFAAGLGIGVILTYIIVRPKVFIINRDKDGRMTELIER